MHNWCCGLTTELLYGDEYAPEREAIKQCDHLLVSAHLDTKHERNALVGDAVYSTDDRFHRIVWRSSSGQLTCSRLRNARGSSIESQIGYMTRGDPGARGTIEVSPDGAAHLRDLFHHCSYRRLVVKLMFIGTKILTDRVDIKTRDSTGWHYGVTRDQLTRALFSDDEINLPMRSVVLRFVSRDAAYWFAQLTNTNMFQNESVRSRAPTASHRLVGICRRTGRVHVCNYDECMVSVDGPADDVAVVVQSAIDTYDVTAYYAPEDRVFVALYETMTVHAKLQQLTCDLARVGENLYARVAWHPTASYRSAYARSLITRRSHAAHREQTSQEIHAPLATTEPDICRHGS